MIDLTNWNYCHYEFSNVMASIFLGGFPKENGQTFFIYSITLVEKDSEKELFQKDFDSLDLAIREINAKYSTWSFIDPTQSQCSSGGCSAH